jgi:hypothetical protein
MQESSSVHIHASNFNLQWTGDTMHNTVLKQKKSQVLYGHHLFELVAI